MQRVRYLVIGKMFGVKQLKEAIMGFVLGLIVGAVIGWHVPQPEWAKKLLDKLKG